jgi:hypothetical protein
MAMVQRRAGGPLTKIKQTEDAARDFKERP